MDTTTALGHSSGKRIEGKVYRMNAEQIADYDELLRQVITHEYAAFVHFYTLDDVLDNLACGDWQAYAFLNDQTKEILGLVFTSMHRVTQDVKVLNIQFATFQHFYVMARLYDHLEYMAEQLDFDYIESITLPVVAEYAVKKKGFAAPSVYIRKAIAKNRRN